MTQNNLKIAITGGIGSGKSTVVQIIARHGYSVLSCDKIYKELLTDKEFCLKLSSAFGNILNDKGEVDTKKLSAIVFSDRAQLKRLNEITHPIIIKEALDRMSGGGINFLEVPLLFEGGFENLFDNVIVVLRNKEERIAAVINRDNLKRADIEKRIKAQYNYDNSQFEKYYVIHNNSDLKSLRSETLKIIKKMQCK